MPRGPRAEALGTDESELGKRINDITSSFEKIASCSGEPINDGKDTQVAKLNPEDHDSLQSPVTLLFLETGFKPDQISTDSGDEAPSLRLALLIGEKDDESAVRYGLVSFPPGCTDVLVRIYSSGDKLYVKESDYKRTTEHEQTELLEEALGRMGTDEAGLARIAEVMETGFSNSQDF